LQALTCAPETWLPRQADGSVRLGRITLHPVDDQDYQDLLTFQYVVMAGKPGADRLAKARVALEIKENEAALLLAQYAYGADAFEQKRIMAAASARMGQLATAERLYREALELRPEDTGVTGELGILLVAMNRPAEARDLLESALHADPHNDRTRGALGLVYTVEGRAGEAFEALQTALEASFEHAGLVPHLVETAQQLERLGDIAGLVGRYADFYPGNSDLAYNYAALLFEIGRNEEACDRLETLLLLAPTHKPAQELLERLHNDHD
jgi:cytochrome c-type biogenesis protein CcmH/NrfG